MISEKTNFRASAISTKILKTKKLKTRKLAVIQNKFKAQNKMLVAKMYDMKRELHFVKTLFKQENWLLFKYDN